MGYLAYILCWMRDEQERIRSVAGYLLKNNSPLILTSSPEVAQFVKASVLEAFNDSNVMIRNTAGQDLVAFLGILEPKNWPECLACGVANHDIGVVEGFEDGCFDELGDLGRRREDEARVVLEEIACDAANPFLLVPHPAQDVRQIAHVVGYAREIVQFLAKREQDEETGWS